jgi:hypothetical protein
MDKNFIFRLFESGDEDELIKLLELSFRGWPKFDLNCSVLDYWRWKHLDNPVGPSIVVVTKKGSQIIGCNHGIPLKLKIFHDIYLCSQGADDAVSPNFRGMGISIELQNIRLNVEKKKLWTLNYGAIGDPILIRSYKKRYNHLPIKISHLVKVTDIELHLDKMNSKFKIFKKYGYYLLNYLNKIKILNRIPSIKYDLDISDINYFDDSYDLFWNNIKNNYSFILEKTKYYLNWRYCDSRSGSFIIKKAMLNEKLLGFIVLKINKYDKKYPEGYIVDLITLSNFYEVGYMLVQEAQRFFDENNINAITAYFVENSKYEDILISSGFIKLNKINIFYQHLNNDINIDELNREDPNKIHFTMGDTDWI